MPNDIREKIIAVYGAEAHIFCERRGQLTCPGLLPEVLVILPRKDKAFEDQLGL